MLKNIRNYCKACMNGNVKEINHCTVKDCDFSNPINRTIALLACIYTATDKSERQEFQEMLTEKIEVVKWKLTKQKQ